jgi:uncharacterized protein YkwD
MRRIASFLVAAVLAALVPADANAGCLGGLFGRVLHPFRSAKAGACYSTQATFTYQIPARFAVQACAPQSSVYVQPSAQAPYYAVPAKTSPQAVPLPPSKAYPSTTDAAPPPPLPPDATELALPQPPPPEQPQAVAVVVTTDPYGFQGWLNYHRAMNGLRPLRYSAHLAGWAYQNSLRGFGHAVRMGRRQNAAWGQPNAQVLAAEWMASPGHRDAMLDPNVTEYGIALAGNAWTLDLN